MIVGSCHVPFSVQSRVAVRSVMAVLGKHGCLEVVPGSVSGQTNTPTLSTAQSGAACVHYNIIAHNYA